ncbi:MAG: hypothetical protein JWL59_3675 [Chthoniobacteraceae bacterium]|nr:hypothetical protein [Chthoniobacteraceae bacterium]
MIRRAHGGNESHDLPDLLFHRHSRLPQATWALSVRHRRDYWAAVCLVAPSIRSTAVSLQQLRTRLPSQDAGCTDCPRLSHHFWRCSRTPCSAGYHYGDLEPELLSVISELIRIALRSDAKQVVFELDGVDNVQVSTSEGPAESGIRIPQPVFGGSFSRLADAPAMRQATRATGPRDRGNDFM